MMVMGMFVAEHCGDTGRHAIGADFEEPAILVRHQASRDGHPHEQHRQQREGGQPLPGLLL